MIWLRFLEMHTHKVQFRYRSYLNKICVRKTGEEARKRKAVLLSDEEKSTEF